MAKFCLACGDPLGTRQLMHDTSTCERCRASAALSKPAKAKSGLLQFVEDIERRNPLPGTGRLESSGHGPA